MLNFLLLVQEHAAEVAHEAPKAGLLDPKAGLMFWTLLIFVVLFFVLSKFAFKPITKAVEDREKALQDAIDAAKRDREEAMRILAEHKAQLEGARNEAQKFIAEGRAAGEKMRAQMIEETHVQQQDMLNRARREIESERDKAIDGLRREAVDLAIRGATKVVEKNMDDASNRKIVEDFLGSISVQSAKQA